MNIDIEKLKRLQKFSKTLKVLYVEDNKEARESTYETLSEFFDNITIAIDGKDGLEKFKESKFDIVITDINMPKMNGIDMIRTIREEDQSIPILIISAYSESGYFIETIKLGVEGYLLKPIDLKQFINMISKTIEKIKMVKEIKEYQQNLEGVNIKLNKDLKEQIYKDQLTGLNNRFKLEKDIYNNQNNYIALYIIDINNFRKINEAYGFEKGNDILFNISQKIQQYADNNKFDLYKISADEFVLLKSYDEYDLESVHNSTQSILDNLDNKKLYLVDIDEEILLNITIGLAFDKDDLLTKASSALDLAKVKNKKYLLFDENDDYYEELQNLFHWQKEIKKALDKDNIIPFFQPIFDKNKNIVKYEVLMRLRKEEDREIKHISPFFFLDISIKTKQYDQLSYRVISKALDMAKNNKDNIFSINIGYRDMINQDIKELIRDYVTNSSLNKQPCNLVFEIVESEDIEDYNTIKDFFESFTCTGLKVAIDDFGSGYSNFSHILEIMPEYLKIDGSLIKDIDTNQNMFTLTKAIISFAKQLGIKTIAEYVHSSEIFEILKKEGVDEYQGFYLGEPSP
ncbi:MAG: EAL domain-containing protein, partial [Campylobacterota bacterium]|nr:EAL domain-containing protein [Campylobacterota bacterium]